MSAPIVVGFDPHGADDAPVHFGLAAARRTGAPLIVAAVYGGGPTLNHADGEFREELSDQARGALERLRARLADAAPVPCEVQLIEAVSPARGLATALEDLGAGLGVVGATDRGTLERTVLGSTAERVIHGAPCPVAVVPHGFEGGDLATVGVAFTPSAEGEQALRSGVALAHGTGAALRVITVLPDRQGSIVLPHASDVGRPGVGDERIAAQQRVVVENAVEAAIANAGGGALEAEIEIVYGDAAESLLGFTTTLDLLVMGSRAYGPQRAVLLGGVSRRVITAARCPVIVLPRGAEHPLRELLSRQAA